MNTMTTKMEPHRVMPNELQGFFAEERIVGASASTVDRSQRKRLCFGTTGYTTERRYTDSNTWEVIYTGTLKGATDAYNRLS